jgi:mono/diheme cytochrome c family protein
MPDASALLAVFGRTHVLLVHFPIALLIVAAGLTLWPRRSEGLQVAARVCLALGLLGALAAASSGWVLSTLDPPDAAQQPILRLHRALSLLGTGAALLAWLSTRVSRLARPWLQRGATVAAALVVGVSSHLGGQLVHGEDWLTAPLHPRAAPPASEPPASEPAGSPPAPAADPAAPRVDFASEVLPILQSRCIQCHGPEKVRGKLRLDSRERVFDPARRDRWVIEPGHPERSELYRRISLPDEDEDRMPGKGLPLDAAQIETLRTWIAQGADWPAG